MFASATSVRVTARCEGHPCRAQTVRASGSHARRATTVVAGRRGRIPAFVVGPPPGGTADAAQLADLSAAFADVATRRRVPFVDTYTPLAAHDQWLGDLAAGDGVLPGQAGYGLMAWLVLHTGWHAWLGLPDDGA